MVLGEVSIGNEEGDCCLCLFYFIYLSLNFMFDLNTALHFAAQNGDYRMAALLISSGADVRIRGRFRSTSLVLGKQTNGLIINVGKDIMNPTSSFLFCFFWVC